VPSIKLPPLSINQPSQMPNNNDTNTWRVLIAKTIAKMGGSIDQKL
jgi:hypothetical protein